MLLSWSIERVGVAIDDNDNAAAKCTVPYLPLYVSPSVFVGF
jgi:hypothetical protein